MANAAPGSSYGEKPNPFIILGLDPCNSKLTLSAAQLHTRRRVIPHVFERGVTPARTRGPNVPTWTQVNTALQTMKDWKGPFEGLRRTCACSSPPQKWNPLAPIGSIEAKQPPTTRPSASISMQSSMSLARAHC